MENLTGNFCSIVQNRETFVHQYLPPLCLNTFEVQLIIFVFDNVCVCSVCLCVVCVCVCV